MKLERLIITWVSTGPGGAEVSSRILAEAISSCFNIEVDLIVWYYVGLMLENKTIWGGRVRQYPCRSYEEYLYTLGQRLRIQFPGTLLFSNQRSFTIDLEVAREYQVKTVIIFRGLAEPHIAIQTISPGQSQISAVNLSTFSWKAFDRADAAVAISDCAASALREMVLQPARVLRIYNALSDDWLRENLQITPVREQALNFLIVSRLVPWKSVSVALAAFSKLASEFPATHLHILGDGPEKDELVNFVERVGLKKRIIFEGWVEDPKPWYYRADCLIHTAPLEGFGRVLAEANACQVVAIAPESGAGGELVIDGETGFTFKPENVDSLYLTLKKFVELDGAERQRMAQKALDRAKELFNAKTIASQYFILAQKILDSPSL